MNKTRRSLGLAALLLSLAGGSWAQGAPIKVGVILPLSGGAGPQGQHVTQAIQAMAVMLNERGGVLGRQVEIVVRDDESTPAVGVSRANDLLGLGVAVILEGWDSPVALAMQPVITRAGVLDITLFASADSVLSGEGNPLAMRLNASNSQGGAAMAQVIASQLKGRRIAFLTESDAYGNGTQASIEAELKRLGHAYEKAMAANELKTLDREAIARRIRGGAFKDTVFGDASFAADGQMQSRTYAFKVQDGRIVVQK